MILGNTQTGVAPFALSSDRLYVTEATLATDGHLSHLAALVDGLGGNAGPALLRGVVFDADGVLIARGDEVEVVPDNEQAWTQFRFAADGGVGLPAGDYSLGVHVGGVTSTARLFGIDTGLAVGLRATDTYADGTAAALPATTALTVALPIFAAIFEPFVVPTVDDAALARLPWNVSQRILGATAPLRAARRSARAGWHDTATDSETSAFCIVRSDGPFADLVGERLRVASRVGTRERVVWLYCHDEQAFPDEVADEDLSLTRRAFMALGPLSSDALTVSVEVMA